jgi:prepilin-type N-terminal cleavage/methylation domain-containing protein
VKFFLADFKFYRKNPLKVYNLRMKTKGFTLVEILLVIFLIGILATAAITTYINSTTTFKFLANYQQVTSALRTARSNAMSNKQIGGVMPNRYGVCISATNVTTFADTGDKEFKFDLKVQDAGCFSNDIFATSGTNEDTKIQDKSFDLKTQGYAMKIIEAAGIKEINLPVLIFYESGSGNLTAIDGKNAKIDKALNKYFSVSVEQIAGSLPARYIRVYQVSGLAEESTTK